MRWRGLIPILIGLSALVSGCGTDQGKGKVEQNGEVHRPVTELAAVAPNQTAHAGAASPEHSSPKESEQASRAKPPKQTFPEIQFRPVSWIGGSPVTTSEAGIWLYTKENHPADASLPWDKNDLLLLRLPPDQFAGHELRVLALQKISEDAVRIVTKVTPPRPDVPSDMKRHPAAWLSVDRGVLTGKRFVVVDEGYKELPTD